MTDKNVDLDSLTFKELKERIAELENRKTEVESPKKDCWKIGQKYLIRTVTMILTGRLKEVYPQELVLTEAAWIADTGRFMTATEKGEFGEVEPWASKEVIVGRGSVIDAGIVDFDLPKKQK